MLPKLLDVLRLDGRPTPSAFWFTACLHVPAGLLMSRAQSVTLTIYTYERTLSAPIFKFVNRDCGQETVSSLLVFAFSLFFRCFFPSDGKQMDDKSAKLRHHRLQLPCFHGKRNFPPRILSFSTAWAFFLVNSNKPPFDRREQLQLSSRCVQLTCVWWQGLRLIRRHWSKFVYIFLKAGKY